jgi:hypothetical protein
MSNRTSPPSINRSSPHSHHQHHSPTTRSPGGAGSGNFNNGNGNGSGDGALRMIHAPSPLLPERTSPTPFHITPLSTTPTPGGGASMPGGPSTVSSSLTSSGGHRTTVRPPVHAFQDLMRSTPLRMGLSSSPPHGTGITASFYPPSAAPTAALYGLIGSESGLMVSPTMVLSSGSPQERSPDPSHHIINPSIGMVIAGSGSRSSWSRGSAPASPLLTGTGSAPPASPGWPNSATTRDKHLAEFDDDELFALVYSFINPFSCLVELSCLIWYAQDADRNQPVPNSPAERDGAQIHLTNQMRRLRVNPERYPYPSYMYAFIY